VVRLGVTTIPANEEALPHWGLLRHGKKKLHLSIPRFDVKRNFVRNIIGIAICISYVIIYSA